MVDGSLKGLCLSGLRTAHGRLRLAHDERAALRPLRPTRLREPLPTNDGPSGAADVGVAPVGEADRRGSRRPSRLDLSRLAS